MIDNNLFECLLQGIIREVKRVYSNANQKQWPSGDYESCSEWWGAPEPVQIGEIFVLRVEGDALDDDLWISITCGGKSFTVEYSGKRIGMYGPHGGFTSNDELVPWFQRTMSDLAQFDRKTVDRIIHGAS